jgi:hypothetical protein
MIFDHVGGEGFESGVGRCEDGEFTFGQGINQTSSFDKDNKD